MGLAFVVLGGMLVFSDVNDISINENDKETYFEIDDKRLYILN